MPECALVIEGLTARAGLEQSNTTEDIQDDR